MKIKKVISVIKKRRTIRLFKSPAGDRQLLSDGYAAYDVSSFPDINTEEQLAAVLSIDKPQDYSIEIAPIPEILLDLPMSEGTQLFYTSVVFGGVEYVFFTANGEIYAVDRTYLKPFDIDEMFYVTKSEKGPVIIAGGLTEFAYIFPMQINEDMKQELEQIIKKL